MPTQANHAAPDGLHTFPRLLLHHARTRPNAPAMREKDLGIWQTWTWSAVADRVRALACGLAELGFRRGVIRLRGHSLSPPPRFFARGLKSGPAIVRAAGLQKPCTGRDACGPV